MAAHRKEFCKNGHSRVPENINSSRNCKLCQTYKVRLFKENNPERVRQHINTSKRKQREQLHDSYLNLLIHVKTGLTYAEITAEDRSEWRRRITQRRTKQQGGQHAAH